MSIYSNDNIRKITKLTTRELPQKSWNAKITVRENNGLYSKSFQPLKKNMYYLWTVMTMLRLETELVCSKQFEVWKYFGEETSAATYFDFNVLLSNAAPILLGLECSLI